MIIRIVNAGNLLLELEVLCQRHAWNGGIYLRNNLPENLYSRENGDGKLLCRFVVENTFINRTDVCVQPSDSSAKVRHLSPKHRKLSGSRKIGKRVRRNVLPYHLNCGLGATNRAVFSQTLLDRIEPRENCGHGNHRFSKSNICLNVVSPLTSFCVPSQLAIREQHCKESDDRRYPTADCRDGRPIESASWGERKARNHNFGSDQRTISIWVQRHCAMEATSV